MKDGHFWHQRRNGESKASQEKDPPTRKWHEELDIRVHKNHGAVDISAGLQLSHYQNATKRGAVLWELEGKDLLVENNHMTFFKNKKQLFWRLFWSERLGEICKNEVISTINEKINLGDLVVGKHLPKAPSFKTEHTLILAHCFEDGFLRHVIHSRCWWYKIWYLM